MPRATPAVRDPLASLPPGYVPRATALTYRIPLADLGSISVLDRSIAVTELVHAMRQNPKLELFLAAYVEEADVKARHADARSLADWLFLEVTRYFATRGVDPTRIRGKGMGVDPRVGRGIVAYLEFPPPSAKAPPEDAGDEEPTPEAEDSSEALA